MKKLLKGISAVIFAAFMLFFCDKDAFAWDINPDNVLIQYENVPENTAFIDILFEAHEDDGNIVALNEYNAEFYSIDGEGEIVRYSDGYLSFLFRNKYSAAEDVCDESGSILIGFNGTTNYDIFNEYREFKIAFCDAEGNILGVTNSVKADGRGQQGTLYDISVNGKKLVCNVDNGPYEGLWKVIRAVLLAAALIVACIILLIVSSVRRVVKRRYASRKYCEETEEHGTEE